jgi:hypothetical protein
VNECVSARALEPVKVFRRKLVQDENYENVRSHLLRKGQSAFAHFIS